MNVSFGQELDLAIRRVQVRAGLDVALRHCEMLVGMMKMICPEYPSYPLWVELIDVK